MSTKRENVVPIIQPLTYSPFEVPLFASALNFQTAPKEPDSVIISIVVALRSSQIVTKQIRRSRRDGGAGDDPIEARAREREREKGGAESSARRSHLDRTLEKIMAKQSKGLRQCNTKIGRAHV